MSTTAPRPTPVEEQVMRAKAKRNRTPLPKVLQEIDAEEPPYKAPVELQAEQMRKDGSAASVKKADLQKIIVAGGGEKLDDTGKDFTQERGEGVALPAEGEGKMDARMTQLESMVLSIAQSVASLQPTVKAKRGRPAKKAAPKAAKKAVAKKSSKRKK